MKTFEEWCQDREVVINELSPKFLTMAYKIWGEECFYEAKKYEAENAALRERLEKMVELPCKIGDEVYEVHGKCDGKNCPYNGYYGQWRCSYGGKTNCNPFITVNKFCYSDIPRVGKTIFVTKEAAEARLAELKGGEG